jgi:hypothetical protein
MEIAFSKLADMLSEAFEGGYIGEDRQNTIAAILETHKIVDMGDEEKPKESPERVYTCEELTQMAVGTVFIHSTLGRCTIHINENEKHMIFDDPSLVPATFRMDDYPWTSPMKLVLPE